DIVPGASPLLTVDAQFVADNTGGNHTLDINVVISTTKGDAQELDLGDVARDLNLRLPDGPTVSVGGGGNIDFTVSRDLGGHAFGDTPTAVPNSDIALVFDTFDAIAGFACGDMNTGIEIGVIGGDINAGSGPVAARFPIQFTAGGASRTLNNWDG